MPSTHKIEKPIYKNSDGLHFTNHKVKKVCDISVEKMHVFHFLVNDTFKRAENMSYICSTGLGIPDEKYAQEKVKGLVKEMFPSLLEKKVRSEERRVGKEWKEKR